MFISDENFMEGPGLFGEGENFFGDDPPNRRDEGDLFYTYLQTLLISTNFLCH